MTDTASLKSASDEKEFTKLSEVIGSLYEGRKLGLAINKVFDSLEQDLDGSTIERLSEKALESDKELSKTLNLAEFLLDGSHASRNRQQAMAFVERVVSGFSVLSSVKTNTVFQTWLDKGEGASDFLQFFARNLEQLEVRGDHEDRQTLKDKHQNTIICIAAIWLYFKEKADFSSLLRYLSRSAFDTKGEAGSQVEANAFAFASSMITSTKKRKFAYFLKQVSAREEKLTRELDARNRELLHTNSRLSEASAKNARLFSDSEEKERKINDLNNALKGLEAEIKKHQEIAKHADIHHNDSKDDLRIKFARFLEGELSDIIDKAVAANNKSKTGMVDYQLNDAIEVISKELKWLKQ